MPDEAPELQDQPTDQLDAPEETSDQPTDDQPESFTDFDPSEIPEDADREWLAERYKQMQGDYSRKTMEVSEGRRQAEEAQALFDGLRDPNTMPHYLRLLGYDPEDPEVLKALGIPVGAATDELDDLLDDEPDIEDRLERIEREREEERQERAQEAQEAESEAEEQALGQLADRELGALEEKWGVKLEDFEDFAIRQWAESNPDAEGLPDYAGAAKVFRGSINRRVKEELQLRQDPGRGNLGGKPGGKTLDPSNEEDRIAIGAAAAEKAMASQQ